MRIQRQLDRMRFINENQDKRFPKMGKCLNYEVYLLIIVATNSLGKLLSVHCHLGFADID